MAASDVIVVGGGIIGCTPAWRLASAGSRVTLIERGQRSAVRSAAGEADTSTHWIRARPAPYNRHRRDHDRSRRDGVVLVTDEV